MNNKRTVQKLSSVIDLLNHHSAKSIGKHSVRIMYEYDGKDNHQKFTVLNGDIPKDSADSIISWLKNNVTTEDIVYGLKSNKIDVETFKEQTKAA